MRKKRTMIYSCDSETDCETWTPSDFEETQAKKKELENASFLRKVAEGFKQFVLETCENIMR